MTIRTQYPPIVQLNGCPLFRLYGQDAISKVSRSMYLLDHILHRGNIGRIKALPPRSIDSPVSG